MKQVYILFSQTKTVPSRMIRFLKGGPFTHCSISLLPSTEHFYSYARRKIHNPLVGGLIKENLQSGIFAYYANCPCALYSLQVSDASYKRMKRCVDYYMRHYNKASYNMLGLLFLGLGVRWQRKYKLTCSQFVSVVLQNADEVELPKDPYLMCPNDLLTVDGLSLVYNGPLCNCTSHVFQKAQSTI